MNVDHLYYDEMLKDCILNNLQSEDRRYLFVSTCKTQKVFHVMWVSEVNFFRYVNSARR